MNNKNKDNGKILLASLAGLGAGVVAGLLLAPEDGRAARQSVMQSLNEAGDEVNNTLKRWTAKVKAMSNQGQGSDDDQLVMQGSWTDVKRQLRNNYDDLTEEDLDYQEGSERELLDRLQRKLGKTKDEVVRLISQIGQ
ncbi:YtxH domain-containing protein [Pontibacter diazotrophicus]|uniref:YtxH domain-containing protein n=1 Tax=Pontibacter diazotrophicus TaxID=1400979 RepID=A0A3D8LI97_9BACT|nr:YtxH domain-containing protein [Pontibacter diazotrophicus]RDV17127.1 YtxH domain-containing protein [Pontibacter diazotrophicus]